MLVLALDTATKVCSVALARDGELLAEYNVTMGFTHSESLLPQIDQIFARTGIKKSEVNQVAVSIGPGSFTGLRIGLATAEAIAYALHCSICGVNTIMSMTYNLPLENIYLMPVLDAQKGNYYRGIYVWEQGKLVEKQAISIVSGQALLQEAAALSGKVMLLGECTKIASLGLPANTELAAAQLRMPHAGAVALAAQNKMCIFGDAIFAMAPYYLIQSEAEELWKKKHPSA
jgi:tRNA threonylcarbamoyladenosine biosynthesis protein TsaB